MIWYLDRSDILQIHLDVIEDSGGGSGIRTEAGIESAVVAPQTVYFGQELYPTITAKAAIICFEIITQHPFIDGNKRIGHAAMAYFLRMNDHILLADDDEQEKIVLSLAEGKMNLEELTDWVEKNISKL